MNLERKVVTYEKQQDASFFQRRPNTGLFMQLAQCCVVYGSVGKVSLATEPIVHVRAKASLLPSEQCASRRRIPDECVGALKDVPGSPG